MTLSRDLLCDTLAELSTMIVDVEPGAVVGSMPFDNRGNSVGIALTPAFATKLAAIFPGVSSRHAVSALLGAASEVVANV